MEPFENYKNKVGRFVSEYGFQGVPSFSSFVKTKTYLPFRNNNDMDSLPHSFLFPERIAEMVAHGDITKADSKELITYSIQDKNFLLDSINLKSHQKHPTGFQTINTYMERDYRIPKDFKNYIYISQLLQADGLKTAIEAHRRSKPKCMGSLYWQLNDCWPGVTWSSVDYYGTRKAAYYQAKRSFDNVLVSLTEENNQYSIYIINDELKAKNGTLDLSLIANDGKVLWSNTSTISIPANSSAIYFSINKYEMDTITTVINGSSNKIVLAASLKLSDKDIPKTAVYYFVKPKDFILTKPTFDIKLISDKEIEITTDVLARGIMLPESFGVLSDNFFDLMPGEKRIITTKGSFPKEPLNSTNFVIYSFYDSCMK
jgi:beta-mannosidase